MTLTKWEPLEIEWPERLRRWLDLDVDTDKWMRIEESRQDGQIVVRAEMPGIDPDKDVDVWVADGMLHISAKREERADVTDSKTKGVYRSEFHYGEFARTLPLPMGVNQDAVKATYRDGILEVRVPCEVESPKIETKKVPISRA